MSRRPFFIVAAVCFSFPVFAESWVFGEPIEISEPPQAGVFHHLESSGHQSVAAGASGTVVVWEDNRDGEPAVWLAHLDAVDSRLTTVRISGAGEAFEPAVVALKGGAFAVAWEERGSVWIRRWQGEGPGPALELAQQGRQASLSTGADSTLYMVWSQMDGKYSRIRLAQIQMSGQVRVERRLWIDREPPRGDQSYPAIAEHPTLSAVVVAWEDRRYRNTVLMSAIGRPHTKFSMPMQINGQLPPQSARYGRGTGAARLSLAGALDGVVASWADKRNFRQGHDIYAAFARASGRFDANERVQDGFGAGYEQWHPAVASRNGTTVVVWDDDRDGNSDIWLSVRGAQTWSDDLAVPGASGPGLQVHPSVALGGDGALHLAWVERQSPAGPTRVRYLMGRRSGL